MQKSFRKKQRGWRGLLRREGFELNNLLSGRETWQLFCRHSRSLFIEYFIPTIYNGYRPKILRAKSLVSIVVFAALVKIFFLSYLFLSHPGLAKMSVDMSQDIFRLVNESRSGEGLENLSFNPVLTSAAMAKAQDMINADYFSHTGLDGKKPWEWIVKSDYDYVFVGENLAMNFFTAESVHQALMNSETHRKNILAGKYVDIGIAVLSGKLNGEDTNILVEIFGAERETDIARSTDVRTAGTTDKGDEYLSRSDKLMIFDVANSQIAEAEIIPNKDIEYGRLGEIQTLGNEYEEVQGGVGLYKIILFFIAILLVISLAIKILVNIHIQHKMIILQSVVVIIFIFSIIYFKFHQLEGGSAGLLIL